MGEHAKSDANADLIRDCRTDIPALCATIEALTVELANAEDKLDAAEQAYEACEALHGG